jgi:anti-anti-sigma regulatory factor
MLRITEVVEATPDGRAAQTLKLEGSLCGELIVELRRVWGRVRDAAAGAPIQVDLADVTFIDAAGRLLLAQMHRDGVAITARGLLCKGILAEIIAACPSDQ